MYIIGTKDGQPSNSTVSFVRPSDPTRPTDPNVPTLELSETRAQIHLTKLRADSFVVSDDAGNVGYAREVQKISYSDQDVLLTSVTPVVNVDIKLAQIYLAAFRRAPETGGYNYWVQQEASSGIEGIANTIFSIASVKQIYPDSMTQAEFVTAIYNNVFNRTPDAEGLNYWTGQLNNKSRGALVVDMTNAALGAPEATDGKDFFENRLDWSTYAVGYQQTHAEMTPDHLVSLTSTVGENAATVLKLVGQGEANVLV